MRLRTKRRRAGLLVPVLGGALAVVAACGTDTQVATRTTAAPSSASAASSAPATTATASQVPTPTPEEAEPAGAGLPRALPSSHVHAVSRDPGTGEILVATHEGLYVYGEGEPRRVGPSIDLMGFTVAGPRHYLASGHPGPGVDLPQPVGLIESRDGGRTWTVLSRGGASDFHALAAGGGKVVGFDGALRVSGDGRSWGAGNLTSPPRALAVAPDGRRVLATTADGLMSSTDGGARWSAVKGAPLLLLVDWVEGQAVAGLDTAGRVHVSHDGGATWRSTAVVSANVQAMTADKEEGALRVRLATDSDLVAVDVSIPS